ncbi:MAG: hypothetical protein GYB31_03935 [Bacteroidetes bacterium]|nr:hypothetical protein [Bacteroidota bacterium]
MPDRPTELIRNLIRNAATDQALDALSELVNNGFGPEQQDEVSLLFAKYSDFKIKLRKNLIQDGDADVQKNQINLTILSICRELEPQLPEETETPAKIENTEQPLDLRLKKLENQLEMIHRMLERLTDDALDRFQHTRIWQQLDDLTRDHLLAATAMERDDYLEDYSIVVLQLCEALENELRQKIFRPYREAWISDGRQPEKELFYDHNVGQVKNHLYRFLMEDGDLSLSQMIWVLHDNLNEHETINRDTEHFLHFLKFLFHRFRIKNLTRVLKILETLSNNRYDRKARSFVFSKEEADNFKQMSIDLLSMIQTTRQVD